MHKRKSPRQGKARGTPSSRPAAKSPIRRTSRKATRVLGTASALAGPIPFGKGGRAAGGPAALARLNARLTAQSAAIARIAKLPAVAHGQLRDACDAITRATAEALACPRISIWRYAAPRRALGTLHLLVEGKHRDRSNVTLSADRYAQFFDALDRDVAANNACGDFRTRALAHDYLRPHAISSMIALPIRIAGRLSGMLTIEHTGPQRVWVPDERRFARSMADFVGATFEAAEREASRADAVTAKASAEAASQAKTDFLSSMSHELRTPLNAIIGFSEIMSEQAFGPLLPRYHDYVSDIHKSAAHLLHIINDVLDIARIESGKMTLYEEPVELRALVEDCFAFVRERAAKKDILLDAHVPTAGVVIRADDSRIRQIVLNLLSNAVKFTPQGGRVWIAVNRGDDDCVCITVGDTGIGMRPDEIPRALEPFRQVDSMVARSQEGSGLGLPISKNLAALHGASFVIDSAVGRGTVVTMTFPKERTLRPEAARASAAAAE